MGFEVRVNGEKVWESEGEADLVDRVSVQTSRGEAASVGSAPDSNYVDLLVNIRSQELTTNLDIVEREKAQERREALEVAGVVVSEKKSSSKKKETESVEF